MNILFICGAGAAGAAAALVLGEYKREYGALAALAAGLIILLKCVSDMLPAVDYMRSLGEAASISPYLGVVLKSLGIGLCAHFGAELCRDMGQAGLASKVEFAGKIMILAVVLPVLSEVIGTGINLVGS